jgi:predicted ATP-grasp superfamily ATP-dependent carboligase
VRSLLPAEREKPPILLVDANYYGTLAAARSLGRIGVPVYVAGPGSLGAARWSRHVLRAPNCPAMSDTTAFVDWLLDFGARHPGTVLYPTSDDSAYIYGAHLAELSRFYRMYQPDSDTLMRVLDKKSLWSMARKVGIDVPDSWFPESEADVARIARDVPPPFVLKSRTQVLSKSHGKGVIVTRSEDLLACYRREARGDRYGRDLVDRHPEASQIMVQQHFHYARESIYELSAFVGRSGDPFVAAAARKVLQRPRSLGIGLCFEHAPVDGDLAEAGRRLAMACGNFGVMQLEFIEAQGRRMLIDFNPRFYNQLAFDVARGLPMPCLAYAAARGDDDELRRLVREIEPPGDGEPRVFCNRIGLGIMLTAQLVAGQIGWAELSKWRGWLASRKGNVVDPTRASDDAWPGVADAVLQIYECTRHPRSFFKKVVCGR